VIGGIVFAAVVMAVLIILYFTGDFQELIEAQRSAMEASKV